MLEDDTMSPIDIVYSILDKDNYERDIVIIDANALVLYKPSTTVIDGVEFIFKPTYGAASLLLGIDNLILNNILDSIFSGADIGYTQTLIEDAMWSTFSYKLDFNNDSFKKYFDTLVILVNTLTSRYTNNIINTNVMNNYDELHKYSSFCTHSLHRVHLTEREANIKIRVNIYRKVKDGYYEDKISGYKSERVETINR